ncbi:MAG: antibiotic biosynthesis monooxygenase family protein [Microthrixaceae bacterium]
MSVVKINAIEVPEGAGGELESRFAARAGAVENSPGFEQFMLMRPVEGDTRYFVLTQWESEEAFQNWMSSRDFAKGHANAGESDAGSSSSSAGDSGGDQGGAPGTGSGGPPPVASGSSLLAFEVVEQIPHPGS